MMIKVDDPYQYPIHDASEGIIWEEDKINFKVKVMIKISKRYATRVTLIWSVLERNHQSPVTVR